jgi:hypothetical protein
LSIAARASSLNFKSFAATCGSPLRLKMIA